jgi:hypothetical protein
MYAREVRLLRGEDPPAPMLDHREEPGDAANDLRRFTPNAWRLPLTAFGIGTYSATTACEGSDRPAPAISAASTLVGFPKRSEPGFDVVSIGHGLARSPKRDHPCRGSNLILLDGVRCSAEAQSGPHKPNT